MGFSVVCDGLFGPEKNWGKVLIWFPLQLIILPLTALSGGLLGFMYPDSRLAHSGVASSIITLQNGNPQKSF